MIRPMIVMTTSISTSVKPAWPPRRTIRPDLERPPGKTAIIFGIVNSSVDDLIDRQQRSHDGNDKAADYHADDNDRQRADNSDHAVEAALQFRLVEIGDASGKHGQLARILAKPQCPHR